MKMISYLIAILLFACTSPNATSNSNQVNEASSAQSTVDNDITLDNLDEMVMKGTPIIDSINKSSKEEIKIERKDSKTAKKTSTKSGKSSKKKEISRNPKVKIDSNPSGQAKISEKNQKVDDNNQISLQGDDLIDNVIVFDHEHKIWNSIVTKNVTINGEVKYASIAKNSNLLGEYLSSLKNQNPSKSDWSRSQKMAFWINAYNAFTIKLIIDNYPLKSILELENGKVWDKVWIEIGGTTYSLNHIEHNILRKKYKDPRIHFAVNCAAKSCPPIWNKAWTSKSLESALNDRTNLFINNSKYNLITASEVIISKIFEWYASDFGDVHKFINKYSNKKVDTQASIKFKEYDWNLNQ